MSDSRNADMAAQDLARQLLHPYLGFVLFFCSAEYDLEQLGPALEQHFGGVPLAGCTTAGEITPGGYGRGCITAIGFDHRMFAIDSLLIRELDDFSLVDAQGAVEQLLAHCRQSEVAPIKGHTFAITLLDGLSSREEFVLSALGAALGSIPHFGGSAGDDNHLIRTYVYYGGRFHAHAAVVVMVNTWLDFEVFTTHHLQPRQEKLIVTAADSARRTVIELNAEPAAAEYARLVGVPLERLDHDTFARHALAVKIGGQYYVRSIQRVNPDLSLSFYCAVETGIVLTAMEPGPMLPDLEQVFAGIAGRLGRPMLIIGCDCFLRRLEAECDQFVPASSRFLSEHRVIGFNTYGEQYNGMHINQTFTGGAPACPECPAPARRR